MQYFSWICLSMFVFINKNKYSVYDDDNDDVENERSYIENRKKSVKQWKDFHFSKII